MLLDEIIKVAFGAIRANKMRSVLTMLGIVIGIAAVITMVALGEGAQRSVQERLQALGTNVLSVNPGQQMFGGVDRGAGAPLLVQDAEALLRDPRAIKDASPEMDRRLQVAYGNSNANTSIRGVWPSGFEINNLEVTHGRLFNEGENRGRRRVAVIGARVGEQLNVETTSLLGKSITIRGISFDVIGVLKEKGQGMGFGGSVDDRIYIPLATAQFRVFGQERVNEIQVQAHSPDQMNAAMAEIERVLRREHRIRPGDASDFNIRNQATLLDTFQETTRTFSFLLAGIAIVSLVVGGIGIMNIMLVSVTERTREIGVRKALGARRRDIMLQFLIEALVLCIAGGILGLGLGVGAAVAMAKLAAWNTVVAPQAAILAIGFSAFIGIFFGMWPARRAASLDPIVSLRYE
ncbi:MAG TPA: ABC transporter permease [Longimicrobiales bacterium]